MQTIKNVLDQIMMRAIACAIAGDEEGAVKAATAGKNICELAQALDLPPDAPFALLEAARRMLMDDAEAAKQADQGTAA